MAVDKLEQIKRAAQELIAANEQAKEMFGCISAVGLSNNSIQVYAEDFVPLMNKLQIEPTVEFDYPIASGLPYKVTYIIDDLTFFWVANDETLKKYNLFERRPIL